MAFSRLTGSKEVVDSIRELRNASSEKNMIDLLNSLQAELKRLSSEVEQLRSQFKTEQQILDGILLNAAQKGNLEGVKSAITLGAAMYATNDAGLTPFFLSVMHHYYPLAEYFIDQKIDWQDKNIANENILFFMCKRSDIDAVKFILDKLPKDNIGASFLLETLELIHTTAFDIENYFEIKQLLATALLLQAAKQGKVDLAAQALEYGANKDAQDKFLETALHKACYAEEIEMVNFLLTKSCSITKKDINSQTAIEVTSNSDIKTLLTHYLQQHQNATKIQTNLRGFFARKNYREEVRELSKPLFANFASEGKYTQIEELAKALNEERLHDALRIIREQQPPQEVKSEMRM